MISNDPKFVPYEIFQTIVRHAPLASIDIIVCCEGKVLLGKRVNKPAQGYYFTTGGIIRKDETYQKALSRIAQAELGIEVAMNNMRFVGVFEHFYDDGIVENCSTHYINHGYILELQEPPKALPKAQHSEYKWFDMVELLQSDVVHPYVKDYFRKEG